jgi:bifunctional DNA-binding transcriptional regulator/antitoxin component of YhaV-PrlF toxin-antitoxin module
MTKSKPICEIVVVSSQGDIRLPLKLRQALGIKRHEMLELEQVGKEEFRARIVRVYQRGLAYYDRLLEPKTDDATEEEATSS